MLDHENAEANKKLIRDYTAQVFNKHDATAAVGFMSPDAQWHGGTLGTIQGAENIAGMLGGFFAGLPDLVATEQEMVAEGELVSVRFDIEATHEGPLFGIPATGRRLRWDAIDLYRISDGRIVEEWALDDALAILNGVGAYTPPWLA
jgi:predicted ester cyclase